MVKKTIAWINIDNGLMAKNIDLINGRQKKKQS
jgi:hypothetical protein